MAEFDKQKSEDEMRSHRSSVERLGKLWFLCDALWTTRSNGEANNQKYEL